MRLDGTVENRKLFCNRNTTCLGRRMQILLSPMDMQVMQVDPIHITQQKLKTFGKICNEIQHSATNLPMSYSLRIEMSWQTLKKFNVSFGFIKDTQGLTYL